MGDLERSSRRLDGFTIGGRPVFARAITNADLERKDEEEDAQAELRLVYADFVGSDEREVAHGADGDEVVVTHTPGKIERCGDVEERKALRAEARGIAKELRRRDVLMMSMYIEDENGEPFPEEQLMALPFRVSSKLSVKASEYAFGVDEEERPTTATSGSG